MIRFVLGAAEPRQRRPRELLTAAIPKRKNAQTQGLGASELFPAALD